MSILFARDAEPHKDAIRKVLNWILDHFADLEEMQDDLDNSDHPLVSVHWKHIKRTLERTERDHQRREGEMFLTIALWIVESDSAYRDQYEWAIKEVWSDPSHDAAVEALEPKPPERWYANLHTKAQEEAADLRTRSGLEADIDMEQTNEKQYAEEQEGDGS